MSRRSPGGAKADLLGSRFLLSHALTLTAKFAYFPETTVQNVEILPGLIPAFEWRVHGVEKRIVYILRSQFDPSRHYVGITNDLAARLEWHNHGPSGHTLSWRPWVVVVSIEFRTERDAVRFEKYLKSGSGRTFARRHFAPVCERPDD